MKTKAQIQSLIEEITDNGQNTAEEVRNVLTDMNNNTPGTPDFEYYSKNLSGYGMVTAYSGDNIVTDTFTTPNGPIVKAYTYDASSNLTSIVLSGLGFPTGIYSTKTFTYTNGEQTGVSYS